MDSLTLELFRCLQSEPYDETGLKRIRELLSKQRRVLYGQRDLATLREIAQLLEDWARAAGEGRAASHALQDAASIAERELQDAALVSRLNALIANRNRAQDRNASGAAAYVARARRRRAAGDLDGAIEAYEQALSAEAELATVRQLADLFAMRGAPGDAQQAADLYCTLGDVLGNVEGSPMLERALSLYPEHGAARELLAKYNSQPTTQPAIVVPIAPVARRAGGAKERIRAAVQAKLEAPPPLAAVTRNPDKGPPPLAARKVGYAPPLAAGFALPSGSPAAQLSSLSPVVRKEIVEPLPEPRAPSSRRWLVLGGLLTTGAAAAAAFAFSQGYLGSAGTLSSTAAAAHGIASGEHAGPPVSPATPSVVNTAGAPALIAAQPSAAGTPVLAGAAGATNAAGQAAQQVAPPPPSDPEPVAKANDEPDAPEQSAQTPPAVQVLLELAKLSGGKLVPAQLSAALDKVNPKLDRCYAQLLKKKPRAKGRITLQWTIRLNGRVASVKKVGDSVNDATLAACTQQSIAETRFPKPRKQVAVVRLPFEYRRAGSGV